MQRSLRPTTQWQLKAIAVEGVPQLVELSDNPLALGRDPANDVVLPEEPYPMTSAHHATVELHEGVPVVRDLGSSNGTFVNDERVDEATVENGDVVELGLGGPRFAVVQSSGMNETMAVELDAPAAPRPRMARRIGTSPLARMRRALGGADRAELEEEIRRTDRRSTLLVGVVLTSMVALLVVNVWLLRDRDERHATELALLNRQLERKVEEAESRAVQADEAFQRQRAELAEQKEELEQRLARLDASGRASKDELARLRSRVEDAREELQRYDPVNVEQSRLAEVARVRRSIVLVEATITYADASGLRTLHVAPDAGGDLRPNLTDDGEPYRRESNGSGYCASRSGYILTNAHVARPPGSDQLVRFPGDVELHPRIELNVVFSDSDQRHPARVVHLTSPQAEDLALIKIEPFPGMPFHDKLDLELEMPRPGTEVFLFGFPLGKDLRQEGDRVIASTFKGILSRQVDGLLQVDAAVHPGNSGGPLTDSSGRVVGIVSEVQLGRDGSEANAIGFVIPASRLSVVWPPPTE